MFEKLLDKGKCRIGLHVGDWVYSSTAACEQERVCSRCQARSQQVVHIWPPWAAADPTRCDRLRVCVRCGDEETKFEHVWDAWTYTRDDACTQVQSCSRCGARGAGSRVAHDWGAWQTSAFYGARVCVCRHCAEMVLNLEEEDDLEGGVSFQATHRALCSVISAPDLASIREHIEAEADLLMAPAAARCLEFSIDQLAADDEARSDLRRYGELLERCRIEGIEAVFGDPSPAPAPPIERSPEPSALPALGLDPAAPLGAWRSTEVLGGSGLTMTTDTCMVLEDDGRFAWWSRSASPVGVTLTDPLVGSWSSSPPGDVLTLAFDDGTELVRHFIRSGNQMTFPGDSRYGFWERMEPPR